MSEARRILVIDDEPGMCAGLAEVLARGGFTVEVAATGEDGLARLALGGVDLLVTDLRLPGLGGLDVVREARRAGEDLPVIVITADGTVEDAVTAMKLGAFDFLTKPFSPADLLHLAGRALAGPAPAGERGAPTTGRPRAAEGTPPRRRAIVSRDPAVRSLAGRRVRDVERQLIFETLQRTRNNRTQAARLLGISIRTLRNKLAGYRQLGEQDPTSPEFDTR